MKPLHPLLGLLCCAAATATLPLALTAGTYTFAEFDGQANNAAIPNGAKPEGGPDGVTASWNGFRLHTTAGDTPMSLITQGDQALIGFSPPVVVSSINTLDTASGGPLILIGKLHGLEVWRYTSPGDHDWLKVNAGAGIAVDNIVLMGRANQFDDIEVDTAPDTDGDGFFDADEVATGHDKNDPSNNPTATAIADSMAQFGSTQGENDWFFGYRNVTKDGGGANYDPATGFIEFPSDVWTGSQWDMTTEARAPWTELGPRNTHPNAGTGDIHWTIRRWVANSITKVTPLAIRWHTHHQNITCGGDGVTGALYRNGQTLEKILIGNQDDVGVTHTYYVNANPGDRFDLILSAKGTGNAESDGCDGSENWMLLDTVIPSTPLQPDGSVFVPAGAGDTDGDGLPDTWEKIYFSNDLTKLSATGDFDKDGLSDLGEYQRSSDPTKADTDSDGLGDLVETGTGTFVSKTDTGSDPAKKDTDGDTLTDNAEVDRGTNPNKADSDEDSYSDSDEISWGTNPLDGKDTPTTYVIANSQADFSGTQGKNDLFFGYRIYDPAATTVDYNPNTDFIAFPGGEGQGDWDGVGQTWAGTIWDLNTAAAGPWTEEGPLNVHPNGVNSPSTIDGSPDPANEHWVIRRWVAKKLTKDTPVTIIWQVRKTNLAGTGVSGYLFLNGKMVDSKAIEGTDGTGEIRRLPLTLKANDIVDLALSPTGLSDEHHDGSDGSETWFWVDTRPVSSTPTLSVTRTATGMTITFTGTLQGADRVTGTYTDIDSSGSYTVASFTGSAKFYRARQ